MTKRTFWISAIMLCATISYGQTKPVVDSAALIQAEAAKFVDSLTTKTSIKEFQTFLDENISSKQYREGKFADLYDYFVRMKYNIWIQTRQNPKK